MGITAIDVRGERKIGGVWIWVGVGNRKKRDRVGNLRVTYRRETRANK